MTAPALTHGPHERYRPRALVQADPWQVGSTRLKVYGLLAEGRDLSADLMRDAEEFVRRELPSVIASEGASNDAGFVIVHPGDLGVSVLAHWWIQGSVLCQRIRRKLYGADTPLDAVARPVIACVWELAVIDAEQKIWRATMMGDEPDLEAYMAHRVAAAFV